MNKAVVYVDIRFVTLNGEEIFVGKKFSNVLKRIKNGDILEIFFEGTSISVIYNGVSEQPREKEDYVKMWTETFKYIFNLIFFGWNFNDKK